jgi:hypothetical protein
MVRVRRVAEAFTPDGLSDRWHALSLGARMLLDEVAQGQAEAETELRERFGLVPHGMAELSSVGSRGFETLAERAPQPPEGQLAGQAARPREVTHHRRRDQEGED